MFVGCCRLQEGDRVVMVQEYADGGDLFNLLQKYGGCLSERVAVQMVLDPFLRVLQVRQAHAALCFVLLLDVQQELDHSLAGVSAAGVLLG